MEYFVGLIFMVFLPKIKQVEPFLQPAQKNSSLIWMSTPLIQIFALIFFYLFYKKGHTWKSKGIVVGYEYQSEEKDKEESKAMTKFKGQWVSHSDISGTDEIYHNNEEDVYDLSIWNPKTESSEQIELKKLLEQTEPTEQTADRQ